MNDRIDTLIKVLSDKDWQVDGKKVFFDMSTPYRVDKWEWQEWDKTLIFISLNACKMDSFSFLYNRDCILEYERKKSFLEYLYQRSFMSDEFYLNLKEESEGIVASIAGLCQLLWPNEINVFCNYLKSTDQSSYSREPITKYVSCSLSIALDAAKELNFPLDWRVPGKYNRSDAIKVLEHLKATGEVSW